AERRSAWLSATAGRRSLTQSAHAATKGGAAWLLPRDAGVPRAATVHHRLRLRPPERGASALPDRVRDGLLTRAGGLHGHDPRGAGPQGGRKPGAARRRRGVRGLHPPPGLGREPRPLRWPGPPSSAKTSRSSSSVATFWDQMVSFLD